MPIHEPWSIKSRSHCCHISQEAFEEGEIFYTALFPDPDSSAYLRKDYKISSWKKRNSNEAQPFSFWKSSYVPAIKEEKIEVTQESPEQLLEKLIEEDAPHTENMRYILAIMLERKKLLKEVDTQTVASGTVRIYEHKKTGEVFIVKDPNIPLSQVEKIQDEVSALLANEDDAKKPKE